MMVKFCYIHTLHYRHVRAYSDVFSTLRKVIVSQVWSLDQVKLGHV